jgi:hypothetical protein
MADRKSIASVLLFAGSTLCFFLPFVTVSCGGIKAFTLTGRQLATGTTITQPQAFGPPQTQKIDADPIAAIAGLCGIAGIALSLIGRKMAIGATASGGLGAFFLLILRSKLNDQLQKESQGMAQASFESGYTLAILLLIAGAAWNIYLFRQSKKIASANAPSPNGGPDSAIQDSGGASSPPPCAHCGKPIREGVRFCESCGRPTENTAARPEVQ